MLLRYPDRGPEVAPPMAHVNKVKPRTLDSVVRTKRLFLSAVGRRARAERNVVVLHSTGAWCYGEACRTPGPWLHHGSTGFHGGNWHSMYVLRHGVRAARAVHPMLCHPPEWYNHRHLHIWYNIRVYGISTYGITYQYPETAHRIHF